MTKKQIKCLNDYKIKEKKRKQNKERGYLNIFNSTLKIFILNIKILIYFY